MLKLNVTVVCFCRNIFRKINKSNSLITMSREKFFHNPYPDYSPECAKDFIINGKVRQDSIVSHKLQEKWDETISKFKCLDHNDYSVYTGISGIALLLLKKNIESKQNLEEVRALLPFHRLKKKRHSFLCGDAGPLAIGVVIDYKLGRQSYLKHIDDLKSLDEDVFDTNSDLPNEYLYGRAGYLFSILYVNKHIAPPPFSENFIRKIIETILICGKNEAKAGKFSCPLMYQWQDSYYLGAAHGLSGILYLLLQLKEFLTETELHTLIKPTVDYLGTLRFPSGNFPSSLGREQDKYVQWCHGSPGFVYLFSSAYKVFGDIKYLQLALESGDVVWERGLLKKGYSICHGASGNAYCFLELYQTTEDEKHLYRAIRFAEWCVQYTKTHEEYSPDRPLSLFEGISGPMYLLLDMQDPQNAKFPGFTL